MLNFKKLAVGLVAGLTLVAGTLGGGFAGEINILRIEPAYAWPVDEMNKTINQTNFILDDICSATLIDLKHKLVLTNYHCVDEKIRVEDRKVTMPDGSVKEVKMEKRDDVTLTQKAYRDAENVGAASLQAEIVAHKKRADLALLKIKADTIPQTVASPILPNGAKVVRGERVYIVGNPAMLDASVVEGVVSSVTRVFEVPWADGEKVPFYQVSGGLTGGNSGGSLYNDKGQLIGVPAAGFRAEFLGLAIQVQAIKSFLKEACYEAVFNPAAEDPEKCIADKKAKHQAKESK